MVGTFPWHCSFSRIRLMCWNAEYQFCCLTALPQCLHRWGWLLRIRFVLTEPAAQLLLFVAWVQTCAWNCALPALWPHPSVGNVLCQLCPSSLHSILPAAQLWQDCEHSLIPSVPGKSSHFTPGPQSQPQGRGDGWPLSSRFVLLTPDKYYFSYNWCFVVTF